MPSLGLVLGVLRAGREERRGHFEALDEKAGLVIGFAGVLVTLSNDISEPWRALGVVASVVSAGLALSSFWPRRYEVLDNVRDYLAAPEPHTQLVLVDTLALMNLRTDCSMGAKALEPLGRQRWRKRTQRGSPSRKLLRRPLHQPLTNTSSA